MPVGNEGWSPALQEAVKEVRAKPTKPKAEWGTAKVIGKRYAQPYHKGKRGIRRPLFIQNLYEYLREAGLDIPRSMPTEVF